MSVDTALDTSILESLAFDIELPCECGDHHECVVDQPAAWNASVKCPACGARDDYVLCEECRARKMEASIGCDCGYIATWPDFLIALNYIVK